MTRIFSYLALWALLLTQSGCILTALGIAAAGVSTTISAMDEEVSHSYPHPYWMVYRATHTALDEMSIPVESVEATDKGDRLLAATANYPVIITLHKVTPLLVNVTVSAGNNVFQLDAATGEAIVKRVEDIIYRTRHSEPVPR